MSEPSPLDPAALERLRRLGGDEFAGKMAELFLSYTAQKLAEARQALADGKPAAVAKAVHPIHSSAGNIGAGRVQELATRIESLAIDAPGDSLAPLVSELAEAFEAVKLALDEQKHALTQRKP